MKYINKQVEIEAIQFTGENFEEIKEFAKEHYIAGENPSEYHIKTIEGLEKLNVTDYVVKENEGVMYPLPEETFKVHFEKIEAKVLDNTNVEEAVKANSDLKLFGDGDAWKLISKASTKEGGWIKSTKAMSVNNGVIVQVTTQQGDNIAEALVFVPGAKIHEEKDSEGNITSRSIR